MKIRIKDLDKKHYIIVAVEKENHETEIKIDGNLQDGLILMSLLDLAKAEIIDQIQIQKIKRKIEPPGDFKKRDFYG